MRKGILLIGSMAAIAFVAGAAWAAAPTPTPRVPFPSKGAALYKTSFVHAMEPCDLVLPGAVTLHAKGVGGGKLALLGCQAVSSDALRFEKAQLLLKKKTGKIILTASLGAANAGKAVALGLTLRSSREQANFWEGNEIQVTYLPLKLTCWSTGGLLADAKGKIHQTTYLDQCAPIVPGAAQLQVDPAIPPPPGGSEPTHLWGKYMMNIEVLDAVLLDVTNGKYCAGGVNDGDACTVDADCPPEEAAGLCNKLCVGGARNGLICVTNPDCPAGTCVGTCPAGSRVGKSCDLDANCPDLNPGACVFNAFGRAGIAR